MSDHIDVSMIPAPALLAALYNNARVQGLGVLHAEPDDMTAEQAAEILDANTPSDGMAPYFDYLNGRVMKVAINGETLHTRLYDRDNGPGEAQRVVDALLQEANND